jgi:hypothetical protein
MATVTTWNLDDWLESWARWCQRGGLSKMVSSMNFQAVSLGSSGGGGGDEFDEVEIKIEALVSRFAVEDPVAVAALRLDYLSRDSQDKRAASLGIAVATYRRKVTKAKRFIVENIT